MAIEIKMPQLSDTMDSGKILSWNKSEGDSVERGDILAEVETDKANLEIESFHQGTLLKIITPADNTAQVGEVIAVIGEEGEKVEAQEKASGKEASSSEPEKSDDSPPSNEESEKTEVPLTSQPAASSNGTSSSEESSEASGRIKASPLAKKLAREKNIDLRDVSGSGPEGRIVKKDLEDYQPQKPKKQEQRAPSPPSSQEHAVQDTSQGSLQPLSKMRQTIAKRMQQSVVEAPHFYVSSSILMDEVVKLRNTLKEREGFQSLSLNHFIIHAVAYALKHEPRVNRAYREDHQVYEPSSMNIGIITAVEDGLIIPVLHGVEEMNLQDIVLESNAVLERVRAGRPQSKDLTGGTFSISNLGMFNVENFTALINPGQGAVLAVGGILDQPVVQNGTVLPGKVMKVTLSVDHRVIDGVMGASFLKFFKQGLESPALLLVE